MSEATSSPVNVCPVCCHPSLTAFRFGLSRCNECSLVVDVAAIRQASEPALQERWFGAPEATQSAWVRRFEAWNNARTIGRIKPLVSPPARVLEVGVGSGSLLLELRKLGFDVHGCDLSSGPAQYVSRELGIPVFEGPMTDWCPESKFDLVILNHVIEHTGDPVGLLEASRRLSRPGALFHVAVPNVASWEARLSGWTSYEPYHLVYFSEKSLRRAAQRAGLHCIETTTYEAFSGWFLAILRTAIGHRVRNASIRERTRRTRSGSRIEDAYRTGMLLMGTALFPLRWLQSRLGAGEELILMARAGGHPS